MIWLRLIVVIVFFQIICCNDRKLRQEWTIRLTAENAQLRAVGIDDILDSMQLINTPLSDQKKILAELKTIRIENNSEDSLWIRVFNNKILYCHKVWYSKGKESSKYDDDMMPGSDVLLPPKSSNKFGFELSRPVLADSAIFYIKIKRNRVDGYQREYSIPLKINMVELRAGKPQIGGIRSL